MEIKEKIIEAFKLKLNECINKTDLTVDSMNIILKVDKNAFRIKNKNYDKNAFILFNNTREPILESEFNYLHLLATKKYNKFESVRDVDIEILNTYLKTKKKWRWNSK